MASIISFNPGRVKLVRLPDVIGAGLLSMDPKLESTAVVITKLQSDYNVNVQFQKTLQKAIYAYTFGDHIGDMLVGGLAFPMSCASTDENSNGVKTVMDYYLANKMSTKLSPILITFASRKIEGYLVGCQFASADPETYACAFTLLLKSAALEG